MGGGRNPTLGYMSVTTLTLTVAGVGDIAHGANLGDHAGPGWFRWSSLLTAMQSQPNGTKPSRTLPSCHPCALCFVAMLACSGGEKLTLQTKLLSKYM